MSHCQNCECETCAAHRAREKAAEDAKKQEQEEMKARQTAANFRNIPLQDSCMNCKACRMNKYSGEYTCENDVFVDWPADSLCDMICYLHEKGIIMPNAPKVT